MDKAELIDLASPPCPRCGSPIQRIEQAWRMGERPPIGDEREWELHSTIVCTEGHRVKVDRL